MNQTIDWKSKAVEVESKRIASRSFDPPDREDGYMGNRQLQRISSKKDPSKSGTRIMFRAVGKILVASCFAI